MEIEVDQSTKIEQSGATVLAFANGTSDAIMIPSSVKNKTYKALKATGKSAEAAHLLVFAAGLFLLLKPYASRLRSIIIDCEYYGHESNIKSFLIEYFKKAGHPVDELEISFGLIGKHSSAHKKAWAVKRRMDRSYRKIHLGELWEVVK